VERVHVLLDYKGKTLSHAYVEVANAVTAGAILRGEALSSSGEKELRGSVLGRGKRARGVTITKSGQAELMSDVCANSL
jgi:Flp pilus assembly protein CpaB